MTHRNKYNALCIDKVSRLLQQYIVDCGGSVRQTKFANELINDNVKVFGKMTKGGIAYYLKKAAQAGYITIERVSRGNTTISFHGSVGEKTGKGIINSYERDKYTEEPEGVPCSVFNEAMMKIPPYSKFHELPKYG